MSILNIPDAGLQLESSAAGGSLPQQAFGLTLSDSMIEDMIKCVQNGEDVQLSLGNTPCFHYGTSTHKIKPSTELVDYDLFLTKPHESLTKAQRLPNPTMNVFAAPKVPARSAKSSGKSSKAAPATKTARAASSGPDSDLDAAQSSSSRAGAKKSSNSTQQASRKAPAKPKAKLLSAKTSLAASANTRSLPSSPALNGVPSPSLAPTLSASQQMLEKTKQQRTPIVHELAVREQPFDYIQQKFTGPEGNIKSALEKVADFNPETQKWCMKKVYWKELDVWNYDYEKAEDRQQAIDNAIKQYDKMRLSPSSPEWERLLPKEDRGKGKVLSKLQAAIAKGPAQPPSQAPKIEVTGEDKESGSSSKLKGGESMARSSSQPQTSKLKKVSEREAQAKRLLSNSKKPAATQVKKAATSKAKAAVPESKGGKKVLSAEFVTDTDDEDDEAPLSTTVGKSKPAERSAVERAAEKLSSESKQKDSPKPKPTSTKPAAARPTVRAPRPPIRAPGSTPSAGGTVSKRPREDDDTSSSSSSGIPLSKKFKQREGGIKAPINGLSSAKHRASDASSQNSRGTATSSSTAAATTTTTASSTSALSYKTKNTSPTKSSPLASSPPANASDFEQDSRPAPSRPAEKRPYKDSSSSAANSIVVGKKRKVTDTSTDSEQYASSQGGRSYHHPSKKSRVSQEVVKKARRFEVFYEKYELLHHEIAALKNPPREKLDDLWDMRERLVLLKSEISRDVSGAAA